MSADLTGYAHGLVPILALSLAGWVVGTARRNVAVVDSLWSLFFLAATAVYVHGAGTTPRGWLMLVLVAVWALRLAGYVTWRNRGLPEDRRYAAIRARNEPFAWKSLYVVFGLQALLAWIISLPQFAAARAAAPLNAVDALGIALWLFGFVFETVGDAQLARFKADARNRGAVMDRGLWRYTRHPNYFGECCVWWGYGVIALASGAWWALAGPLVMTWLLLKVSGVTLLERDIGERRAGYARYMARTPAFWPGRPRDTV
jgi:steroid 5-alpha reductase family enzyme